MVKSSYERATGKTRRKIQAAFAELLAEYGSAKNISVTELAERAEITRGTFYNYYNNINEVHSELQNEIQKRLFSNYGALDSVESIEKYIDDVFAFLKQQEPIYRELLSSNAPSDFLNQLENDINHNVMLVMDNIGIRNKEAETEALFLTNGTMAVVQKYYRGESHLTLEEIRDFLKNKLHWMLENYR